MNAEPGGRVDLALRRALVGRDEGLLAEALSSSRFLLALAGDRLAVLTSDHGVRSLAVFSGPDAARAFGGVERLREVDGAEVVLSARRHAVDTVLIDPAGPAAAEFGVEELVRIADGLRAVAPGAVRTVSDLQVRATTPPPEVVEVVRGHVARTGLQAWVFDRRGFVDPLLTVGVVAEASAAAALAADLRAVVPVRTVDVVLLDPASAQAVAAQLPGAQVRPA